MRKQKKVIKFRPELFWDVDPKTIDPQKHARYIIERVLDLGGLQDIKWLANYYSRELIKNTMKSSRVVGNKSKILWSLVF